MEKKSDLGSLRRGMSVLRCFNPQNPSFNGNEIAAKLGIHRTSAYKLLAVLSEEGVLQRDEETKRYMLGPILFHLGSLYLVTTNFRSSIEPVVTLLRNLTGEDTSVSSLSKGYITLVMREEGNHFLSWGYVGRSVPAYCSSAGIALLSELTDEEIDRLYPEEKLRPITPKTVATRTELKRLLNRVRESGVSFSSEGNYEGIEGISTIVRNEKGRAVAALGFAAPVFMMNQVKRDKLGELAKLGSALASYRLGYQDTQHNISEMKTISSWWEQQELDSHSQGEDKTQAIQK